MSKIDFVQTLHIGNPKALMEVIGFFVETYYETSGQYVFWEKPVGDETIFDTRVKKMKVDKCQKLCFEKMQEIRKGLFDE
jgi:hypothetical protein